MNIEEQFSFSESTDQQIQVQIKSLDPKKATVDNDIPSKMLIVTNKISSVYLSKIYNYFQADQRFPDSLKNADVIPIHKKDEKTNEENYRPVSLLPTISKLFERDMCNKLCPIINKSSLTLFIFYIL